MFRKSTVAKGEKRHFLMGKHSSACEIRASNQEQSTGHVFRCILIWYKSTRRSRRMAGGSTGEFGGKKGVVFMCKDCSSCQIRAADQQQSFGNAFWCTWSCSKSTRRLRRAAAAQRKGTWHVLDGLGTARMAGMRVEQPNGKASTECGEIYGKRDGEPFELTWVARSQCSQQNSQKRWLDQSCNEEWNRRHQSGA